jgi:hypothetical protein
VPSSSGLPAHWNCLCFEGTAACYRAFPVTGCQALARAVRRVATIIAVSVKPRGWLG